MENIFLQILSMSLTAGCVTAVVILVRQFLRKVPKKYSYLLWLVVAFRLICPFSFSSDISVFNLKAFDFVNRAAYQSTQKGDNIVADVDAAYIYPQGSDTAQGIPAVNGDAGMEIPDNLSGYEKSGTNMITIAAFAWAAGVIVMAAYGMVSYVLIGRRLKRALKIGENVYRSDRISTPFVMGIAHPRIYVPCFLDKSALEYVLLHERCHIKRRDYIVKLAAFVLLCIHWFNPLIWLAFHLMGKDMEMSCDETVIEKMNDKSGVNTTRINKDYSYALLSCASAGRFPAPGPLCFGDISVRGRIKNVLNYRKPRKIMTAIAIVICMVALAACSANPKEAGRNGNNTGNTQENESMTVTENAEENTTGGTGDGSAHTDAEPVTEDALIINLGSNNIDVIDVRAEADAAYGNTESTEENYENIDDEIKAYPMPVAGATLTVGYGYRERFDGTVGFHPCDDFAVEEGSEVHAADDGTVVTAGFLGGDGWGVIIEHADGYMTHYYHLQSVSVSEGSSVAAGDVIGLTGQSGNATGPMFSFGVSFYDENNEIKYVQPVYLEN